MPASQTSAPTTRKVRYTGPSQRGRVIGATGQRVRPAGSKAPLPKGPDGKPVKVPSEVDVPADLAEQLIRQPGFEPVGWEPAPAGPEPADPQPSGTQDSRSDSKETR